MKTLVVSALVILSCFGISCHKDDNTPCVKEANYFSFKLDGEEFEPVWNPEGYQINHYNLYIYREFGNLNNWEIIVGTKYASSFFYLYLTGLTGPGDYPIETLTLDDMPVMFSKTSLYFYDSSIKVNPSLLFYSYFSLEDTGSVNIKTYDKDKGVLAGSFSCTVYSVYDKTETKTVTGEFHIDLSTHDIDKKPCWL